MVFPLPTTNPNSLVMITFPGTGLGKIPTVLESLSESVRGAVSHEGALPLAGAGRDGAMFVTVKVKDS